MIKKMAEITQELVIWGSDDMVNAFYKFRMWSLENTDSSAQNHLGVVPFIRRKMS